MTSSVNFSVMAETFTLFPQLPVELRQQIWEASYQRPGIHIFDVCFPQPVSSKQSRTEQAFTRADETQGKTRYKTYENQIFLDSLSITRGPSDGISSPKAFTRDPSMYRTTNALSSTCVASSKTIKRYMDSSNQEQTNSVYLPGKGKRVSYNNTTDALCLHFGPSNVVENSTQDSLADSACPVMRNNISIVLEGAWSEGMAASLFAARRVALDIRELWSSKELNPTIMEVVYLCCCIQNGLEVLYLIDYCVGRCQKCRKGELTSGELTNRKCDLAKELDPEDRKMDVVYGTGVTYREVSDLERLGWDPDHPSFTVARIMGEVIREQQGASGPFRSVRVLVCDEEGTDEGVIAVHVNCTGEAS
ncbi:hypothetical protein EDB81DRAFT_929629 [Dactylonectria macrodidyma]|uniref:2EXR domain-containing protein n=1 Tax=Dactylonectria macrodidyma TaxID=307937 RepID=A0A9P9I6E4_9HYPO|nr:hypothetical protein EDB81DRAFT_929629 [Dactylonectria macrodidyma]